MKYIYLLIIIFMIGSVAAYVADSSDAVSLVLDETTYYTADDSSNVELVLDVSDTTYPTIDWISPTPDDGNISTNNWVYLNTTITDDYDTSAFFDWNYSLIGYWNFEFYNSTGVFDNSTYNHFGIFHNMEEANKTTGQYGNAFKFSGNGTGGASLGSYLDCGNNSDLQPTKELTIDVWIKPNAEQEYYWDGTTGNYGIASSAQNYTGSSTWSWQLRYGHNATDGSLGLQLNTALGAKWVAIEANLTQEWHHIVATFNGTATKLYVDGVLNNTNNFGTTTITTNTNNKILIGTEGWSNFFNGTIDEFKLFNRALSLEEIKASYNNGVNRLNNNFTSLANGDYNYSAYAIDTSGNLNITDFRNVTISRDSCTAPASGIWEVACSDHCNITSDVNIGVERIVLAGTGSFTVLANISAGSIAIDPNCELRDTPGDMNYLNIKGG